jgi:26S proteasome regulatory subunit N9
MEQVLIVEPDLTLTFLQSVHSRLTSPYPVEATDDTPAQPAPTRPIPEAYALSLSSIAYAQLLLGDLPACKKSLDECESLLNEQDTVEPVVNAGYYGVAGDYHKVKADYGPYYKNALLYLACVDIEGELSEEDRKSRAHDLCIAALLGENIYNFGELVSREEVSEKAELTLAATSHSEDAGGDRTRLDQGLDQRFQQRRNRKVRIAIT